jgi:hypothetical protein
MLLLGMASSKETEPQEIGGYEQTGAWCNRTHSVQGEGPKKVRVDQATKSRSTSRLAQGQAVVIAFLGASEFCGLLPLITLFNSLKSIVGTPYIWHIY